VVATARQEGGQLLRRLTGHVLAAVAAVVLLARITVLDTWPLTAWLVYFVPPPLIAGLFLAAALAYAVALAPLPLLACMLAAALTYGAWYGAHSFRHGCVIDDSAISVLSWNVARGRQGKLPAIAEYAVAADADVIGLVEAGNSSADQYRFWAERFPAHQVVLPGGGVVLLVRGFVENTRFRQLLGISSALTVDAVVDGQRLRIVLVDFDASPRFDKRRLTEATLALAKSDDDRPAVIMGDFNTPLDSRWFRPFRGPFAHAFESGGDGLLATWPASWPVVALDHVWVSAGLSATCTKLLDTGLSDHRAFLTQVTASPRVSPLPAD
jgi:endonuclease/exonuclease/phosphatase (EEP) superfamily protein YafD